MPTLRRYQVIIVVFLVCCPVMLGWGEVTKKMSALSIDPEFQPELGTYHYEVTWQKVIVGYAQVTVGKEEDLHKITVHAETSKKLDRVYKVRYTGESLIGTDPISPVETRIHEKVKSKKKQTTIEFYDDGTIKSVESRSRKKKPDRIKYEEINTDRFTLDPFSAACLVRRLDWEEGVAEVFDVFTGKDQYELQLQCIDRTVIDMSGEKRDVWVIVPDITKLSGEEDEEDYEIKQSNVKIYLSADERKELLRIEGYPKIGRVRAQMSKFEPAT